MASYKELLKVKDPTLSYTRYDSFQYRINGLEEYYRKGYWDGLGVCPCERVNLENLTDSQRKAYVHGFFTGDYEAYGKYDEE